MTAQIEGLEQRVVVIIVVVVSPLFSLRKGLTAWYLNHPCWVSGSTPAMGATQRDLAGSRAEVHEHTRSRVRCSELDPGSVWLYSAGDGKGGAASNPLSFRFASATEGQMQETKQTTTKKVRHNSRPEVQTALPHLVHGDSDWSTQKFMSSGAVLRCMVQREILRAPSVVWRHSQAAH